MKRFTLRTAWAWTMIASLALCAAPLRADDEDDDVAGEQLLPKEVLVFFSVPSIPELKERLGDSLTGELLKDPGLQPFLDAVKAKIEENSGEVKDEVGVSLDELLAIPQGEITFAVVELPPRKLGMVLLLDYGDNKAAVDILLDKMEAALKKAGGDVEGEDIGGINVRTFTFAQENENPFNKLAYFDHEEYLAFASDPEALKAVIDRWDGKSEDTFAEHEVYSYILEKCSSGDRDPAFKWFINPIGLTQSAIGMMQQQIPQAGLVLGFLPILGLDKLKGMGGACDLGVEDYDAVTKSFFYVEQPTTGLLDVFQFPATDLAPPKWVPADVAMYSAVNWNINGAYSAVETLVDSFQGPGAFAKLIDQMADREDGPNLHLKKDVIDQLTGQIHIIMGATEDLDEPTPKMMFALDVKNASKVSAVLAKAAKSESFRGKTRDFEGITIYELEGAGDNEASMAVAEKHLLISTDTSLLENALRPSSSAGGLASDPVYKHIAKKFPKKVSMIGFQNGNAQLQAGYQMLKSGNLPGDVPEDAREIIGKLPDFEVLQKYLRASGGYTVPDKKGALSVSFTLKDQD